MLWLLVFGAAGAGAVAILTSPSLGPFAKLLLAPAYFAVAFLLVFFVGLFFVAFWCGDVLAAFKLYAACPMRP